MTAQASTPVSPEVHVAPLPDGHVASSECLCRPLLSTQLSGVQVWVHRIDAPPRWPRRDALEGWLS